jgi:hypothetical protein
MTLSFKIDFDPKDFSQKLERAVKDTANKALGDVGRGLQQACDQVYAAREGKTAAQIYAALRSNVQGRHLAVTIPDSNLKAYAEAIAEGRRVKVDVKGL